MNLHAKKVAVAAASIATGLSVSAAAFATTGTQPTFQEFAETTYQDPHGTYIVNGDEPVFSKGGLRRFYDGMVARPKRVQEDGLVINTINGVDDKWSATQARSLTYCVSDKFGTQKADVVNAMAAGAGQWESASTAIDFIYVPSHDANCNTTNNAVLFSVEPVRTTKYIARAFFPSTPKTSRNVLVDDSFWSMSYTQANVLGHELGHTLGFRHEHTRPEAGTCFEDNNWRPLTPYDRNSIMHYPQCNGVAGQLSFSAYDAQGIRAVYGG